VKYFVKFFLTTGKKAFLVDDKDYEKIVENLKNQQSLFFTAYVGDERAEEEEIYIKYATVNEVGFQRAKMN